ncbi:unnamed protein product [Linum trigynum]|uniref:Uncharacterized protein n=1 Tax=Linum trigynum TaxID=586398 RepID=A0AAV2DMY9_9ROSI
MSREKARLIEFLSCMHEKTCGMGRMDNGWLYRGLQLTTGATAGCSLSERVKSSVPERSLSNGTRDIDPTSYYGQAASRARSLVQVQDGPAGPKKRIEEASDSFMHVPLG